MQLDKAQIIAILHARGQHERADWVDRTLPAVVDTDRNASLLKTLDIKPDAVAEAAVTTK